MFDDVDQISSFRKYIVNLIIVLSIIVTFLLLGCRRYLSEKRPTRIITSSSLPVELLWQIEVDELVDRNPIIINNIAVVSTNQAIYGLNIKTGQRHWKHTYISQPSPVPIGTSESRVIYGTQDGQITALDKATGEVIWQRNFGDRSGNYFRVTSIVIDDDIIYAASQPTAIEAINLDTGGLIWQTQGWQYNIPSRGARLFVYNHNLYVFTTEVHVLETKTGKVKLDIQQSIRPSQLVDRRFYGSDWVRDVITFNLISKLKSPSSKLLVDNCEKFIPPYTFFDNKVYVVGKCGGIYALDTEKYQLQWEYNSDILGESPTAVYRKDLYTLIDNGEIHAIDLYSGEGQGILKTNLSVPKGVTTASGIVADENVIIVTFNDTNVWAFCEEPCSASKN